VTATVEWAAAYLARPVVVFGAGGFIGRRLTRRLAAIGAEVNGVIRPGTNPLSDGIRCLEADLLVPGHAATIIAQCRPAITFNLAAYGVDPAERDPGPANRLNTDLVEELAVACGGPAAPGWRGRLLVHAGSALEYGTATGDLVESTQPRPTTLYGQTKLAGTRALERAVGSGQLRGVTARLFTVYGPGEHPGRLLPTLLCAATHLEPVPLTPGTQLRDFTFVDDVVDGLLRLGLVADADTGAVVNLASGRLTSVREFVTCTAGQLGIASERLAFGALAGRAEEMAHEPVDLGRLVAQTGWRPTTMVEEGVRRTVKEAAERP